jgi:hypothetical protein
VVSAASYLLGIAALAAIALSLGFSAVRLRQRLLPTWRGAPAHLVESIVAIALLVWLSEILGTFNLFYGWILVAASILLAVATYVWTLRRATASPAGGGGVGGSPPHGGCGGQGPSPASASSRRPEQRAVQGGPPTPTTGPAGPSALSLIVTVGVVAIVVAHWGLTTKDALDRGIFNFDSLWYHMPFAVDMVQSHSVTGMHYTDTVFTNWFYPQNSELLHAVGIALTHRDTLSLFLNFGWLAVAFLAAWCIGRPYGRGHLTVVAAAIVLECHTLVVREPGAAKNDLAAAALLLAAIAILVNAWAANRAEREGAGGEAPPRRADESELEEGRGFLPVGWPLAAAGLAVGLAAGTRVTVVAMAAVLTVAVLVLAPAGRRWAAAGWWFVPALLGGGFWYLRNLVVAGNPLPEVANLGPISLPHPERLQTARPDFNIAHYATDTGVWRHYFAPGLHDQFGTLWPLVVVGGAVAALLALALGRDRVVRWMGGVALFGMVAYLFTPLSAAGAEGAPDAFAINVRYLIPALLAAVVLVPLPCAFDVPRRQWALLAVLGVVLLVTDRSDTVLRDPSRVFGVVLALLVVLVPAALLYMRARGVAAGAILAGFVALGVVIAAIGYSVQRDYLRGRYRNDVATTSIPGMHLDSAYRWARGLANARIGLAGTTAGFLQYGLYGTDLSNRVVYLGAKGPHGAFNAIPTCRAFRAAVNAANLDYLVTSPFLNFIHTDNPISSPEAGWLRGDPAATPIDRSGPVTVWRVHGRLDAAACGPANAPLRRIPNAPG